MGGHDGTHRALAGFPVVSSRSLPSGKIYRACLKVVLGAVLALGAAADAAQTPKRGGTLTYMIPAEAGPSLDGHRETSFSVLHATAPSCSVVIRVSPDNPFSTTDFVCDLCTEYPHLTDNGLPFPFPIRKGVKFHDGSPLSAHDL